MSYNFSPQPFIEKKEVVNVFLHYNYSTFLLQLRDMIPTIENPGQWGAFGGRIELDEVLEKAVCRELQEELSFFPLTTHKFRTYSFEHLICHLFYAELTVPLSDLVFNEGIEMGLFSIDEIKTGHLYSQKLKEKRKVSPQFIQFFNEFLELI